MHVLLTLPCDALGDIGVHHIGQQKQLFIEMIDGMALGLGIGLEIIKGEFHNGFVFLSRIGIQFIRENGFGRENIPAMMAAVVVISVPLIILFLIFHKKIMEGVARGGTKG